MPAVPQVPFLGPLSGFSHRVRCDGERWARSRSIYWQVLDALWEYADHFVLELGGRELPQAVASLPGVQVKGDPPKRVRGPATAEARQVLIDPAQAVWFSLTLRQGEAALFYDEDGGDTIAFAAQPDTLERLTAAGVTMDDLIDLGPSHRRAALLAEIHQALLTRLPGSWSCAYHHADPVRLSVLFPGSIEQRAVVLVDRTALEALAAAAEPADRIAALLAGVERLAEPTDGFEIGCDGPEASTVWLRPLPPERRPRLRLPWTHRLTPTEPAQWSRLIHLAAKASDRTLLTIPPAVAPTQLLKIILHGRAREAPDPSWLSRLSAQALATGPALDREADLLILPANDGVASTLMERWAPSAGWPLAFVHDGQVWMEIDDGYARLHLDPSSTIASDPLLAPALAKEAAGGGSRLPWW